MPPKVSVVVPNYNHARFLEQRMNSILEQTFSDFELIILDDHSSDNSKEVIEKYRGNKHITHIVYNDVNSGSSFAQWSKGAGLSSGEYIWIAESDDVADNRFLEKMVPLLDENKGAAIAYAQSYAIDEQSKIIGSWLSQTEKLDKKKWLSNFVTSGDDYIKDYMIYQNVIPNASGVLFRKNAFLKAGNPDGSYRLNGDWKFWISMLIHSDVVYLSECLNYFRTHPQSVRSTAMTEGLNFVEYTRLVGYIFSNVRFSKEEKRNVINHFNRELSYKAPITLYNLVKSYFNLARFDLYALILLKAQIQGRYF